MVVADIVLSAFIAVCAAVGYLSGLAWQVIRVTCLVVAIWLTMLYSAPLADIVRGDALCDLPCAFRATGPEETQNREASVAPQTLRQPNNR
jgi:colicin V production protein